MSSTTDPRCIETDQALTLVQALGRHPETTLAHVLECAGCRARLVEVAAIGEALEQVAPRRSFTEDVVAALPGDGRLDAWAWTWRLVTAGLASATAAVVLAGVQAAGSPPGLLLASGLVGLGVLWVSARDRTAATPLPRPTTGR